MGCSQSSYQSEGADEAVFIGPPLKDPYVALPGWTDFIVIHVGEMRLLQVWLVKKEGSRIILDGRLIKRMANNKHKVAPGNLFQFDQGVKQQLPTEWLYLHTQTFWNAEWNTSGGMSRRGCPGYSRTTFIGAEGPAVLPVVAMLVRGQQLVGRYVFEKAGNPNEPIKQHWIGKGTWSEEKAPADAIDFDRAWGIAKCAWVEVFKSGPYGPIDELADMLRKGGYNGLSLA